LRARHYIFKCLSVSLIRLQRLNDLSSTNDSIVPTILFAFTLDFTCVMCIWLLCIVPCDYSSSFKTDVVIIVITHSQIVNLSIVNRALYWACMVHQRIFNSCKFSLSFSTQTIWFCEAFRKVWETVIDVNISLFYWFVCNLWMF